MNRDDVQKMGEALGLLNSMVLSGEQHSDVSKQVLADAQAVLERHSLRVMLRASDGALVTQTAESGFEIRMSVLPDGVDHTFNGSNAIERSAAIAKTYLESGRTKVQMEITRAEH